MSYAKLLRAEIKRAGSQRALATEWGMSNQTVHMAVKGAVFPVICDKLNLPRPQSQSERKREEFEADCKRVHKAALSHLRKYGSPATRVHLAKALKLNRNRVLQCLEELVKEELARAYMTPKGSIFIPLESACAPRT